MNSYPLSTPRRKLMAAGAAAAGVVLAISACSGGGTINAAAVSSSPAVLKWATTFPTSWDPVVNGAGAQFRPLTLVYASLTTINAQGDPEPGLASRWGAQKKRGDDTPPHLPPP